MYCTVRLVDYIKLKNTHFGITDSSSMAFPAWIIQAGIVLAVCVLGFAVHWMALRRAPQAPRNSEPQSASQILLEAARQNKASESLDSIEEARQNKASTESQVQVRL